VALPVLTHKKCIGNIPSVMLKPALKFSRLLSATQKYIIEDIFSTDLAQLQTNLNSIMSGSDIDNEYESGFVKCCISEIMVVNRLNRKKSTK
jgi:hypothetical protein